MEATKQQKFTSCDRETQFSHPISKTNGEEKNQTGRFCLATPAGFCLITQIQEIMVGRQSNSTVLFWHGSTNFSPRSGQPEKSTAAQLYSMSIHSFQKISYTITHSKPPTGCKGHKGHTSNIVRIYGIYEGPTSTNQPVMQPI